jgi:hypothetical protein
MEKLYTWTFWTLPYRLSSNPRSLLINTIFLLYSTELITLIENTKRIIYTDSFGKRFLKKFNFKTEIIESTEIDNLRQKDISKWAYPKLITIKNLHAPFYHIDHDVFLHKEQQIKSAPITGQSFERIKNNFYVKCIEELNKYCGDFLPEDLNNFYLKNKYTINGINCGFLHIQCDQNKLLWIQLANDLFKKINYDVSIPQSPSYTPINLISEQFSLFYLNEIKKNKMVKTLFEETFEGRKFNYQHLSYMEKQMIVNNFGLSKNFLYILKYIENSNPLAFQEILKLI